MAKEVISRCDECGTADDVQEFTISYEGRTVDVDLCKEHGYPVLTAFEKGRPKDAAPKRGRKKAVHSVVPVEDLGIEPPK